MKISAQLNFYRRGIRELADQCNDADTLDLVYKLLADGAGSTPPLQLHTALTQRVEDLNEWQARQVLSFINKLFGSETLATEEMEVAA